MASVGAAMVLAGPSVSAHADTVTAIVGVGSSPFAVALTDDGARAYVANSGSGSVSVIDTKAAAQCSWSTPPETP
ncbi:hypothetical protein [Prescottella equi]|uniref:hypothetical protein n=1 Tax=Rhodococcus hoagii TaxID=43767 RepID=UPI0007CD9B24|nr:hypothetical protein [Prescottella equi]